MKCQNCGAEINVGVTSEYKPISMWGYLGYQLLFSLPVAGFICVIIFALTAQNKNVKNFARSYICMMIIVFVISFILIGIAVAAGVYTKNFVRNSI